MADFYDSLSEEHDTGNHPTIIISGDLFERIQYGDPAYIVNSNMIIFTQST
jgi:hypothetical protein